MISDLINSKVHKWTENDLQMPDEVQFYFRSPKNMVNFRRSAFENSILLMQNSIFFQKSEISGFGIFISNILISSKKMTDFDG